MSEGGFLGPNFPAPPPPPPEQTFIVQLDPRTDILWRLMGLVIGAINAIIGILQQASDAFGAMAALQTQSNKSIWSILRSIVSDILHVHIIKLAHDLHDLRTKLQDWHDKLKKWIDRYKRLRKQHDDAVRKLLNMIQRIRRILLPFRLLHLKFAQKLDSWLAGVEAKIITHELAIVQKSNEIISWIDLITHPDGGLRGVPALVGIRQFTQALLGAIAAVGYSKVYPARSQVYRAPIPTRPFAVWQAPDFKLAENSPSHFDQFKAGVLETYRRAKEEMQT